MLGGGIECQKKIETTDGSKKKADKQQIYEHGIIHFFTKGS